LSTALRKTISKRRSGPERWPSISIAALSLSMTSGTPDRQRICHPGAHQSAQGYHCHEGNVAQPPLSRYGRAGAQDHRCQPHTAEIRIPGRKGCDRAAMREDHRLARTVRRPQLDLAVTAAAGEAPLPQHRNGSHFAAMREDHRISNTVLRPAPDSPNGVSSLIA
jgi:hypothetical protein